VAKLTAKQVERKFWALPHYQDVDHNSNWTLLPWAVFIYPRGLPRVFAAGKTRSAAMRAALKRLENR